MVQTACHYAELRIDGEWFGGNHRPVNRYAPGRLVVMVALIASTTASASLPATTATSAPASDFRAEPGDWSGFVSFLGGGLAFRGTFSFASADGEVDGTFGWSGPGVVIGGVVSGPDDMPRFDLTSVVSGGVDIADVSGGGEIEFTVATCERLEGTGVNIDVAQMVDIGSIVWWAVRTDTASDLGPFFDSLDSLRTEVNDIIDSLERGSVILGGGVVGRIEPLLVDAEALASQLDRTEGCGTEFYRSVIASQVERLLLHVLANPDVDVFTLGQVLLTAVRGGVIGSGSESDQSVLDGAAQELVADRIASAAESGNVPELEVLSWIAEDLGWDELAYEAVAALVRIGD